MAMAEPSVVEIKVFGSLDLQENLMIFKSNSLTLQDKETEATSNYAQV